MSHCFRLYRCVLCQYCVCFLRSRLSLFCFFFFNDTATTEIYTLSLHDALPICLASAARPSRQAPDRGRRHSWPNCGRFRSEEHTSELQSRRDLVCRLLLEKKKTKNINKY